MVVSQLYLCWMVVAVLAGGMTQDSNSNSSAGVVAPGAKLEKLWDEGSFTEGGALTGDGAILFSDIGDRIMKFDPATGKTTVFREPSGRANGLIFDPKGRLIAAEGANAGGNRRISITEPDGTVRTLADRYEGKRFNSPNDVAVDRQGRVYFSDPRYVGSRAARARFRVGLPHRPRWQGQPAGDDGKKAQRAGGQPRRQDALCGRQRRPPPGADRA